MKRQLSPADAKLFREAVRDAEPLKAESRVARPVRAQPALPVQSLLDDHEALNESLADSIPWEQSMETGEELVFVRDGIGREVLKKLRRGQWVVQDAVDLHGMNREQSRLALAEFLKHCAKRGLRCVRVVHGKGLRSPNREPVLKHCVKRWLAQRDEVLAYCQTPANQGGSGALLVLLRG